MKKEELIKLLQELPDGAEVVIVRGDDILGDYSFDTDLSLVEATGYKSDKGSIWTRYSNYKAPEDKPVKVWEIT